MRYLRVSQVLWKYVAVCSVENITISQDVGFVDKTMSVIWTYVGM